MAVFSSLVTRALSSSPIVRDARRLMQNPIVESLFNRFVPGKAGGVIRSVLDDASVMGDASRDIQRRGEPQFTFHWSIILPFGFPPMYVQDVTIPQARIEAVPFHRGNTKRYDPGFTDVDPLNVTFYEDNQGVTLKYLREWRDLVVDRQGFYGRPIDYKKPVILTLHDPYGNPVTVFRAQGAWPTGPAPVVLNSGGNDILTIDCDLSVDGVDYEVMGTQSGFVSDFGIQFGKGKWWEPVGSRVQEFAENRASDFVRSQLGIRI